jgi:predicted nucleic acid-binding protein
VSARSWSVDTLRKHDRIALDANILIYLLENVEPRAARSTAVLDEIDAGRVAASVATLAYTEVLTGPARVGGTSAFEETAAQLRDLPLTPIPLSVAIAEDAAWIQGQSGLRLADAIHVASARASGATALVTNDRRLRSQPGLEVLYLDEMIAA